MRLKALVAVVTGGGSGIGAAICSVFAAEGAAVAAADLDRAAAEAVVADIRAAGGRAEAWGFGVADAPAVEAAADAIEARLGPISIWANNAGVSLIVPFLECARETWDLTQRVNLTGSFVRCQAALRRMAPRRRGAMRQMKPEEVRSYLEGKIPLGCLCTPEDVAQAAVFLASDDSAYVTRQAVHVNGGAVMT